MAEVDFGDSELFQQLEEPVTPVSKHIRFTDDEEEQEEIGHLRTRVEEFDDHIQRLVEENKCLRRKLNILARPSDITIEDVNFDGPVLQILYTNSAISKQCRQEIEDSICNLILKHQKPSNERTKSTFHMKPQNSSVAMEEDPQKSVTSGVRTTTEAFKVVGSVLYFTSFSLDKLGQPLVNENPQMTAGWEIPTYQQVFNQVIGTDGLEIEMKDKRPKSLCFNCGLSGHQLRDCPKPKDMAAINERRKEFNQNSNQTMQSNQRYHVDEVEERFAKYKPGVMSEDLLSALGIDGNTLPPLIYRMRQLGYPPGWLKEAEMENSGLTMYDGNVTNDSNPLENNNLQNISYDVSKLVDFPGFNVPAAQRTRDEFLQYGSVPMQSTHMKQNFAAYLSNNFPQPGATCNKRRHESDSSPQLRKRTRPSPNGSSDMDIESDPGTPYNHDFQFQPPLPPGSPCFASPPPLPHGTPPATPTPPPLPKGTPPPTPTNGSPALRGQNWVVVDEMAEGTEDDLTLEELEEQQRLIWAALENAETTNSDSGTPALGTPVPSSPGASTPAHVDTEADEAMNTTEAEEAKNTVEPSEDSTSILHQESQPPDICSEEPGPMKVEDDSPQSPEPIRSQEDTPQSPGPAKAKEDSPQSPDPVASQQGSSLSTTLPRNQEETPQSPDPVASQQGSSLSTTLPRNQEETPQSPDPVASQQGSSLSTTLPRNQEETPQSPDPVASQQGSSLSTTLPRNQEETPRSPDPNFENVEDGSSPQQVTKVTAVPHRTNFAAGIVQFEDTPEFTEVAAATGTYLKIRDLLKSSPRSLAKKKLTE
ncbi:zinc finger CCHC domain-containing protein 8 [Nelusetta ayraudi]|uniref:zinc finger CCHC domain-containing protein 8 n=1 Tax=Nelusetta ayraudi TaxID=303726 RepID=UPI003F7099D8